jgi:hypothetical protein
MDQDFARHLIVWKLSTYMSDSRLVRASRDGDQFHYLWAARRCLCLLSPASGLVAVSIEGPSPSESSGLDQIQEGEELIDVAEYYGSTDPTKATRIRYIQLKHSTHRTAEVWTPSGLADTLAGFARRYTKLREDYSAEIDAERMEFSFVSNRPIATDVMQTVEDCGKGSPPRHPATLSKLENMTALTGESLAAFCRVLRLEGKEDDYWDQRNILRQETTGYLPGADVEAPRQLKELVTRNALSTTSGTNTIKKYDVLRALQTEESDLFPARPLFHKMETAVPREQEAELIGRIIRAEGVPILVHAAGGVGKSILATRIPIGLPGGSCSVLYDCFGNGLWRNPSSSRHRHKDALVEIANELAEKGLCHPLVPATQADVGQYMRAFLHRLKQSITNLRADNAEALLCIVIDAADNAQMAAAEAGEVRSFVPDLLRERIPEGVRIVALCRTHRQQRLNPPYNTLTLELKSFTYSETAVNLRRAFPQATEHDVIEFQRLSSCNPRVQAMAIAWNQPLDETLRRLGPNPTTVESTIETVLDESINRLLDAGSATEGAQVARICAGLAVLRPLIPITVLASLSGVHESAIKSFAYDLGRPLLVTGDSIQFFDEPAETWFHDRFKPNGDALREFVRALTPLAESSAYIASTLPQLMLEAELFAELVALALSSQGLPKTNPLERRDVELQRLQFAFKASLRLRRYTDAAKLAMKAAGETAGDERQQKLLQANTDLASLMLDADRIQEMVARRVFGSTWTGSHYAFEAALMSGHAELAGESRSRLRMAHDWLLNWSALSPEDKKTERVDVDDIAEVAIAEFNLHGAGACASYLRRWKPHVLSFSVGRILARRFVDCVRYRDLDELAHVAKRDLRLVLAILLELRQVHRNPPKTVVQRILDAVLDRRVSKLKVEPAWDWNESPIETAIALVEAAHELSLCAPADLVDILSGALPDSPRPGDYSRWGQSRFPLLRGYALRAALAQQPLELVDLAPPEVRKELETKGGHSDSRDLREFREDVGELLPWHRLWADRFVRRSPATDLEAAIGDAKAAASKGRTYVYRDESHTSDEIARVWFDVLAHSGTTDAGVMDEFHKWIDSLQRPLYTPTMIRLARLAARVSSLQAHSRTYASKTFDRVKLLREDADQKTDSYAALARAIFALSRPEAAVYFEEAVAVASRMGDESNDRWTAILDLAHAAADPNIPDPELSYRLSRAAELSHQYIRDKHFDWRGTVEAIAGLSPTSSLAILSRWRDRRFGWLGTALPDVVSYLLQTDCLDPRTALAMTPFRARWEKSLLLERALSACASQPEKEAAAAFLIGYMILYPPAARAWRDVKTALTAHRIEFAGVDEQIAFRERSERPSTARNSAGRHGLLSDRWSDEIWDSIFQAANLTVPNDIDDAFRRFKDRGAPYYHEDFLREAIRRVPLGNEPEFIYAFNNTTVMELYHFRRLLEQIPDTWKRSLAIPKALETALRGFLQRHCLDIRKNRQYEAFPFQLAYEWTGVTEREAFVVVLSAMAETTDFLSASGLFSAVGIISTLVSKDQARDALSFSLDLFDAILENDDGDGPWSPALAPPVDIEAAVAGYVWAGLAAPDSSVRWQAAHVVRGFCTLGRTKVLDFLLQLAKKAAGGPFVDARLFFYHLHARLWLLIAAARSARDHPEALVSYGEFLIQSALTGEAHALIRVLAANAALALFHSELRASDPELVRRLENVNVSRFAPIESKWHERVSRPEDDQAKPLPEDAFYFGMDADSDLFAPLGHCFGASEKQVESAARTIVTKDWRYPGKNGWEGDERSRLGIFRNQETYSRGGYARTDDLGFYLAYHAMMVVAGSWLETRPLHSDPDDPGASFARWICRSGLTRADGYWLADRRDPTPLEHSGWTDEEEDRDWRWSIRRADFDRVLTQGGGRLNLWGRWTELSGQRVELVAISSALVSPTRSESLLRAFQTSHPHHYRLPEASDEPDIDSGHFQLRGWINEEEREGGLDRRDPWAGDFSYPPISPAKFVVEQMDLHSDLESREWRIGGSDGPAVLWSTTWAEFREKEGDADESEREKGQRLNSSIRFVGDVLRRTGMDLIIKVEIERFIVGKRYEGSDNKEIGFIPPSTRLFLLRTDGGLYTI